MMLPTLFECELGRCQISLSPSSRKHATSFGVFSSMRWIDWEVNSFINSSFIVFIYFKIRSMCLVQKTESSIYMSSHQRIRAMIFRFDLLRSFHNGYHFLQRVILETQEIYRGG